MKAGRPLVMACALVFGACGGVGSSESSTTVPDTTTSTAETSTTTVTSTTTTTTTSPTTTVAPTTTTTEVDASRCLGLPTTPLPAVVVDLVRFPGHFGGGPEPQSIQDSDGAILFESGGTWYIGFSLNIPYVVYEALPLPSNTGFDPALEAVLTFDGADDAVLVWLDQSQLSGHRVYSVYYLDDACQVEDAGTAAVERVEFLVGGGAMHREGVTCTAQGVVETSAGATMTEGSWEVRRTLYEWAPHIGGFIVHPTETSVHGSASTEAIGAGAFNC